MTWCLLFLLQTHSSEGGLWVLEYPQRGDTCSAPGTVDFTLDTQLSLLEFGWRKVEKSNQWHWQRVRALKVRTFPEYPLDTTPFISADISCVVHRRMAIFSGIRILKLKMYQFQNKQVSIEPLLYARYFLTDDLVFLNQSKNLRSHSWFPFFLSCYSQLTCKPLSAWFTKYNVNLITAQYILCYHLRPRPRSPCI